MKYPAYELETALLARLTVGASKIDYPVVGWADKDEPYPYVRIGEAILNDWSDKSGPGHIYTISIHGWTRSNSVRHIDEIANDVLGSITVTYDNDSYDPLTLTNYNVIRQDRNSITKLQEIDGASDIYHVVIEIEFWLEEK